MEIENVVKLRNLRFDDLVQVYLYEDDDFLKAKETLTRIGISSNRTKTLYQSCHILHKQGSYAIVHFKELFALDGKPTNFTVDDLARRNTIANLLDEWELVELADPDQTQEPVMSVKRLKILPFREKEDWNLEAKYQVGVKR